MPDTSTAIHLKGLNPEQLEAAEHFEGPILVLAGAGSGKTRVLTARVCNLIHHHGVAPDRILAVTFTNKAAGEMRERISRLLDTEPSGMWVGTFHAVGARLLRRHADRLGWDRTFSIFDSDQSLRLLKSVQEGVGLDPKRWSPKAVRNEISNVKNQLIDAKTFAAENEGSFDLFLRNVARVYPEYQKALEHQNAFDFDDLLMKPVELFEAQPDLLERYRERFAFVLVDEYQDTNRAQFRFVELLAGEHHNLMVVGDDDQSIYGWRGADIRNILDFEDSFPSARTVRLERNYRSTERILNAANHVIAENVNRKGKTLRTERTGGEPLTLAECFDENDEARWIVGEIETRIRETPRLTYSSVAVLYRTNAQARALEDAFRREGVPYQVVGSVRFYERREIQDVLAYLRLISNPRDEVAFGRVVNYPRRGIGLTSQEHLFRWAAAEGVSLLEAAARADEIQAIRAGASRGLRHFADLIQRFSVRATQASVGELLEELIEDLDLVRHLHEEGPDGEDRARNVAELIAGAVDFDATLMEGMDSDELDTFTELDLFLQQVALVADVDRLDPDADTVTLMTLHNAKGLEFPLVFIAGMEEGLFPLGRSYDDPDTLEEERRLFYVGITRAEDKLAVTWARQRRRAGDFNYNTLSSFFEAIPEELFEERKTERLRLLSQSTPHRGGRRRRAYESQSYDFDNEPADDAGLNQDLPRFVKGERVVHDTFGSGSVVEISGFGRDLKVTVDFDEAGRKKLLLRYASLEKDWP
ncbi:MAG: UvrD-helicase domain-containing protein [Gemmatimonadetes bacterium]|nr:UvrD-helicase domain-containing protein [Gemmatimonadota bacterium]NNF14957.1 UvrD-helicase domain-containing protein [Gemmatimonadota bacterium]NNL30913.1 UvrD-helicase domain-containing protein [Gemmatimonadota bacterium]